MGLYERVHGADPAARPPVGRDRRLDGLRRRVHHHVIDTLGDQLSQPAASVAAQRTQVADVVRAAVAESELVGVDAEALVAAVCDDVVGYGPIDALLADESVTEVMCNGPWSVWVERAGRLAPTDITFVDAGHLRRVVDKMVAAAGRRVDESVPLCDARLADGSRVNVVLAPVAGDGPYLTVRKFAPRARTIADLVASGTVDGRLAVLFEGCVVGRRNVVVSGGTGSGKTTLLNVLSSFIPAQQRVVTVEDARELRFGGDHVVSLEARPANVEGRGEVTIGDLVRNSLRMRPDRIVVGEVRSGEALDMLQAMNTGHTGSLTTVHANSPRDALARLETLVLMAGYDLPVRAIREQLASALDLIVQVARFADGNRRVTRVAEVHGMEGDVVVTGDLFSWDAGANALVCTGVRPRFAGALGDHGVDLPAGLFTPGVAR
jgi:pilus assembly protein CpaF